MLGHSCMDAHTHARTLLLIGDVVIVRERQTVAEIAPLEHGVVSATCRDDARLVGREATVGHVSGVTDVLPELSTWNLNDHF